ncbi:ZZ-type zinc finger-containing protein 3 [Pseudolycoriella hygida]|uniref:ZZ-type zinc finger-containing protein 3 n=1 Tax=Pseudolycoriella hygida TaxID=35572 RepID=A0A9Q0S099_9DIPT|nr:ZZ-type zinc finger-containing protein 3 [Pseudolycoriella hygida]
MEDTPNSDPQETDYESNSDTEEFFFESDHLAFRGNSDYTSVLRTFAILQTQKIQAANDIEKLAKAEKWAMENPEEFIRKLNRGELDLPAPISVAELPKINFEKYGVSIPEFVEEPQQKASNDITVRGRVFDQTKPETFNQLWTCEEQRRLEELLIEYPPEPVERRRYTKIARALGNRTTKQVASRLQKYFKKLHSAGMPIPGRIPKSNRVYTVNKQTRMAKNALRPTTFFPANHVPVTINDDDEFCGGGVTLDPNWYRQGCSANSICSDMDTTKTMIVDEDSDGEMKTDNISRMARLLERVKRDKEKDSVSERAQSEHEGFKCDFCGEEPIAGTRWHCNTCSLESIDFCSDCLVSQLYSDRQHDTSHKIVGLRMNHTQMTSRLVSDYGSGNDDGDTEDDRISSQTNSNNGYDKDYMIHMSSKSNYNYLDPNFLPE